VPTYSTPWALQPQYQSAFQPLGSATSSVPLQNTYAPTSSFSIPFSPSTTNYSSTGQTFGTQPAPVSGYSPAVNTALGGATNWSGSGQPGTNQQAPSGQPSYSSTNQGSTYTSPTNTQHSPYSTPSSATAAPRVTAADMYGTPQAQNFQGKLSTPGAYENWYQQNASRYNNPTTLSSYYQQVAGQFGGQRFQPTTTQSAFNNTADRLRQQTYGMGNAQYVSQALQNPSMGEGTMGRAADMLGGNNRTGEYYQQERSFFGAPGDVERYYDQTGDQFQRAGFGENYAQNVLGSNELTGLYDNRLVGGELDYFRDPLRALSNSEQLYNSGNQGLNTYYDRENQKAQEALQNRMAAMGVFGSGETVKGMAEIDADMGAAHARDMAALAGQADQQRLGRAGMLRDFAGAAADEEMARGGMMLEGAGMGLQLGRDAISRLSQGGQLANLASRYGLDRTVEGGELARSADDSRTNQATALGNVGRDMSSELRQRLDLSARTGLDADEQERLRLADYFGNAESLDRLGLDSRTEDRQWVDLGGRLASDVDQGNLDWLNAGGDAADLAQQRFEQRERYGFLDPMALGSAMGNTYGTISGANTTEQGQMSADSISMSLQQKGMDAAAARAQAQQWIAMGLTATQIASLLREPG
jgi:hypothetical protein